MSLIRNPKKLKRAQIADRLFEMHASLNVVIGKTAMAIAESEAIEARLAQLKCDIDTIVAQAMVDANKIERGL